MWSSKRLAKLVAFAAVLTLVGFACSVMRAKLRTGSAMTVDEQAAGAAAVLQFIALE